MGPLRNAILFLTSLALPLHAQTLYEISRMDMRIAIPPDCSVVEDYLQSIPTTRVKASDDTFEILIQRIASPTRVVDGKPVPVLGPQAVANHVRDLLLEGIPDARVLFQESGRVLAHGRTDRPVEQFYILEPRPTGPAVVQGRTFFPLGQEEYAAFSLYCVEPEFLRRGKAAYEQLLDSVEFIDPADAQAARQLAVEAGRKVMERLTPDDLDAVVSAHRERWERYYRTEPDGSETELGFRVVRAWKGARGEMDPTKPRSAWRAADHQTGYLLRIDLRLLSPTGEVTNASSVFFLSQDETQEAWNVTTEIRTPTGPLRATEVGMRDGDTMQVLIEQPGSQPTRVTPVIEGTGYLPQVKAYLLGPLLVRAGLPLETGFYCYQSVRQTIELRRDLLEPTRDGTGWRITTRLTADAPPQVSIYDADGLRTRSTNPDGSVWEPIDPRRLAELWQRKGLPMK